LERLYKLGQASVYLNLSYLWSHEKSEKNAKSNSVFDID